MKEYLIKNGWYLSGTCMCGGNHNEDYKNPNFEQVTVRITPAYNRFTISQYDQQIKRGNSGLEEAIKSLNQTV